MTERALVVTLLARAADAWANGNLARAEEWCRRAWVSAAGADFVDEPGRAGEP